MIREHRRGLVTQIDHTQDGITMVEAHMDDHGGVT